MQLRLTVTLLAVGSVVITGCQCQTKPTPPPASSQKVNQRPYTDLPTMKDVVNQLKQDLNGVNLSSTITPAVATYSCGSNKPLTLQRDSFEVKLTLATAHTDDIIDKLSGDTTPLFKVGVSGDVSDESKTKTTDTTEYDFSFNPSVKSPGPRNNLGLLVDAAENGILLADHSPANGPCIVPKSVVITLDYDVTGSQATGWKIDFWLASKEHSQEQDTEKDGTVEFTINYSKQQPAAIQMQEMKRRKKITK